MLSKHLFHFALVHEQFAESGDLISGLLPLFTPLLADKINEEFSAKSFSQEMNSIYGLDMHPYVAEDLAPKLVEMGVLRLGRNVNNEDRYYIESVPSIDNEQLKNDVSSIFLKFEKYCSNFIEKSKLKTGKINYSDEFVTRLAQLDSFIENYDPKKVRKVTLHDVIDYAFVRFVNRVEDEGGEIKDALNKAYSGSILSEVILSIKEPSLERNSIYGKRFYIDAPILLNILGFNEEYTVKCSRNLMEQIKNQGGVITTTHNYINEAQTSIRNALDNRRNSGPRASSLSQYLFKNPKEVVNVRAAQYQVKEILNEKYDFDIKDALINIGNNLTSQRAKSLRGKLSAELSWYKNEIAMDNDTEAVTFIVADHNYCSIKNISESRSFLITPNESLIKGSNNVLYSMRAFTKPEMTPLLSEKRLATLLWVINGGAGENISSLSLVSSCARAMEMHQDVFYKIQDFIKNLPKDRVKEYENIICNDRALNCLIDEVGSDYKLINESNFEDLLLSSREQYLESERRRTEKRLLEKNSYELEIRKLKEEKERALKTIRMKSTVEIKKDNENKVLESKIRELTDIVKNLEGYDDETVRTSKSGEKVVKNDSSSFIYGKELIQDHAVVDNEVDIKENVRNKINKLLTLVISVGLAIFVYYISSFVFEGDVIENKYFTLKGELVEIIRFLFSVIPFIMTYKLPDFIFARMVSRLSNKLTTVLVS